jgi:hypothetical protein
MDSKKEKSPAKNVFALLGFSINTLFQNPQILKPYIFLIFFQLLVLEILYFSIRFPLKTFFGPMIGKIWNEAFLHYPFNFSLLPKMFQYTEFPIYIFVTSFIIGMAISALHKLNNGEEVNEKTLLKESFRHYVHIIVAAVISFLVVMALFKLYGLVYDRALMIRSTAGKFFLIKVILVQGAPYFNLLLSIFGTVLFAYVIPIIIIENKKIFSALFLNFKNLMASFWFTFWIVFIPSLMFVPVLLLRNTTFLERLWPELNVVMLIATIFVMVFIDAIVYTALSAHYLLKKEHK